jgi:hypothetical protein
MRKQPLPNLACTPALLPAVVDLALMRKQPLLYLTFRGIDQLWAHPTVRLPLDGSNESRSIARLCLHARTFT